MKKQIEINFFSTFQKNTVGGFVNQQIKKFWPNIDLYYQCDQQTIINI